MGRDPVFRRHTEQDRSKICRLVRPMGSNDQARRNLIPHEPVVDRSRLDEEVPTAGRFQNQDCRPPGFHMALDHATDLQCAGADQGFQSSDLGVLGDSQSLAELEIVLNGLRVGEAPQASDP